jgi:site-specific DNA recombinase
MTTRWTAYARYSSDQQRPESIEDQIRHCQQEAARHPDWVYVPTWTRGDRALTGTSVEGRVGLAELTSAAKTRPRPFDLILVDDTSRLARDVVDALQHVRELIRYGVHVYFVNQGLHTAGKNAEFLMTIYGAMDASTFGSLGARRIAALRGRR